MSERERERLPETRQGVTKALRIRHAAAGGSSVEELVVYVTVGQYPDGRPGEIWLKAGRQGELISGLLEALSISVSVGLQSGVPLQTYVTKFSRMQFEPSGPTNDPQVPRAASVVDAVFRWLGQRYLPEEGAAP